MLLTYSIFGEDYFSPIDLSWFLCWNNYLLNTESTVIPLLFFFYLSIYLVVSGLSCGMWDLLLGHVGFSLVVARRLQNTPAL